MIIKDNKNDWNFNNKVNQEVKKSFGFINNQFINLYTKENPLLDVDDECYFLFSSPGNLHRKLIGKGIVKNLIFNDGMNIIYFVALTQIIEDEQILNKFVYGKRFELWNYEKTKVCGSKLTLITEKTDLEYLSNFWFKVECFFIRPNLENINILKKEFSEIIKEDLIEQLNDINYILE